MADEASRGGAVLCQTTAGQRFPFGKQEVGRFSTVFQWVYMIMMGASYKGMRNLAASGVVSQRLERRTLNRENPGSNPLAAVSKL